MLSKEISIINKINELQKVNAFIEKLAEDWKILPDDLYNINLVIEEIIVNILHYAYNDQQKHFITLHFTKENDLLINPYIEYLVLS